MEYKVGDRVNIAGSNEVGTVVRITEKRKDIVVDFGSYKCSFDQYGWTRGNAYTACYIVPLTDELQKQIDDRLIISKCEAVLKRTSLTAEQAAKILAILGFREGRNDILPAKMLRDTPLSG